ncbi:HlyC/CorC family transporter [Endothiovibrio diazotrophicus]
MNEDRPSSTDTPSRSWLDRLTHLLAGEPKDREALIAVLRDAQSRDLLDYDALAMIEGTLQVSEMQARDIMIPRSQMAVVERDADLEEILRQVVPTGHSRFPVITESRDEVAGILLAKDLLRYAGCNQERFNMRDLLRPAIFVPESKRLNVLLKEFRANRNHMAVVVDEFGGVAGLVTIEDVLEQIVGDIEDEHDFDDEKFILQRSEHHYTVKGLTPIDEFNDYFQSAFSDGEFDTIGGLVVNAFGHVPKRGESTRLGRFHVRVLHADKRRIHLLRMTVGLDEKSEE